MPQQSAQQHTIQQHRIPPLNHPPRVSGINRTSVVLPTPEFSTISDALGSHQLLATLAQDPKSKVNRRKGQNSGLTNGGGFRSPLLEDFRTNRNRGWELKVNVNDLVSPDIRLIMHRTCSVILQSSAQTSTDHVLCSNK
jgi:hypothetical protein